MRPASQTKRHIDENNYNSAVSTATNPYVLSSTDYVNVLSRLRVQIIEKISSLPGVSAVRVASL